MAGRSETPVRVAGMNLPTQTELLLPLLDVIRENGPVRAKQACDALAAKIGLTDEQREDFVMIDGRKVNRFDRRVRWTRQNALLAELIDPRGWGVWGLTETGEKTYRMAKPSLVVTVYQSACGSVLWAEASSALQYIEKKTATLCLCSPPYPLVKPRAYDADILDWRPERYLDTLIDHIERIRPILTEDGSFVLNLGPAFLPGQAFRNPYQHRLISRLVDGLGWNVVDEHFWHNLTKPRGSDHVTKTRTHCGNTLEQIFILTPNRRTKCSNLRVLTPYSSRHRSLIESGGEIVTRHSPSRIQWPGVKHRRDNGGSVPGNLHVFTPDRDADYRRYCKSHGLPEHPAMMPLKLAEFFIQLTTEPDDLVVDTFGGSLKTARAALNLDRRFLVADRCLEYLRGAMCRLPAAGYIPGIEDRRTAG